MQKIIEWFQLNYPHIREDLKNSMHNFDDSELNPYHLESDCWSHTMMVCKISQIKMYDKVVQISALLHDIGKPSVRRVNPKNNHVQFFGHERVSAFMSIEILHKMMANKMINKRELVEIFLLIALHSEFYKKEDLDTVLDKFRNHKTLFLHLVNLNECDSLGRFCENCKGISWQKSITEELLCKMRDTKPANEVFNSIESISSYYEVDEFVEKYLINDDM